MWDFMILLLTCISTLCLHAVLSSWRILFMNSCSLCLHCWIFCRIWLGVLALAIVSSTVCTVIRLCVCPVWLVHVVAEVAFQLHEYKNSCRFRIHCDFLLLCACLTTLVYEELISVI